MRHKAIIIIAIVFITAIPIFFNLLLDNSVRTIKHGFLPVQSFETAIADYKSFNYDLKHYNIRFAVPDTTDVKVSSDIGEEMLFSTYLVNRKLSFRGYIQLWKIKDLEPFLVQSKSLSPFDYRSYNISNVKESEYHGFITKWTAEFGPELISGKEYWLEIYHSEEVVRLLILSDTADFPDKLQNVIQEIIDSIQIDKKSLV